MKTEKPFKSDELKIIRQKLYEKTGFNLKDYLIEQAFTRSSYSRTHGGSNNENLEYIGDTIIGYYVVRFLYDHYGVIRSDENGCVYTFVAHEKDFTALKNRIVSNHTLATIMDDWDLTQYLIVGQSDIDNEIDKQEKIKADLFEAIIGAIAVQVKWDQEFLESFIPYVLPIEQCILEYEKTQYRRPEFSAENAINTLKELAEHDGCSIPVYEEVGPDYLGYFKSGNPKWSCSCIVSNMGINLGVFASSKKAAKRYAAYLALCQMFEVPNEYGPSKPALTWLFDGTKLIPNPRMDNY